MLCLSSKPFFTSAISACLILSGIFLTGGAVGAEGGAVAVGDSLDAEVKRKELNIPYYSFANKNDDTVRVDGKTAYDRKNRGERDSERMLEVVPITRPSNLPPPTVVAHTPVPSKRSVMTVSAYSKKKLKGEDAIFYRIAYDLEHEKCIYDPASCEEKPAAKPVRKFLTTD